MSSLYQRLIKWVMCSFALGIFSSAFAQNLQKETIPILVAEYKDDKNQVLPITLFKTKIFSYLEIELQQSFDVRQYPWKRVLYNAENGEGIVFGVYKTPSRMEKFNFSEPVYLEYSWLVVLCSRQFKFNDLADLKGKTIGIVPGASVGVEFDSQVNKLFKMEKNDTSPEGRYLKLYQNRMDAFVYYEPRTNIKLIQEEINKRYAHLVVGADSKEKEVFCLLPNPISSVEVHFAISKNVDQNHFKKLDKVILQARKNGDLKKILAN